MKTDKIKCLFSFVHVRMCVILILIYFIFSLVFILYILKVPETIVLSIFYFISFYVTFSFFSFYINFFILDWYDFEL